MKLENKLLRANGWQNRTHPRNKNQDQNDPDLDEGDGKASGSKHGSRPQPTVAIPAISAVDMTSTSSSPGAAVNRNGKV